MDTYDSCTNLGKKNLADSVAIYGRGQELFRPSTYSKRVCAKQRERLKSEAICDSLDKTELLKLQGFEQLMSRFVQFGLSYFVTVRGWVSCIGIMETEVFRVFL